MLQWHSHCCLGVLLAQQSTRGKTRQASQLCMTGYCWGYSGTLNGVQMTVC
jgi:hypothetical protein